jgi:S1-C subfamily serine protease
VQVADLNQEVARQLNLSRNAHGLLVAWVDPAGPLAGHVQKGDVIDRIEQQQIQNVEEAQRFLAQLPSLNEIHLHVVPSDVGRNGPRTVIVRPESVYR